MQIITGIAQGSDEWLQLRAGKVTGSNFGKVMSKGQGKTRKAYMIQLAAEILTDSPIETFKNAAMEWGNECEPQARAMYEFNENVDVEEVTFIHGRDGVGVSPDGLVNSDGLFEAKCPNTTTQIERYLAGVFPATYKAQVQGQIWVAEREWTDFVSFDPRISGPASYFKIRVERDEAYIKELAREVDVFIDELLNMLKKLEG